LKTKAYGLVRRVRVISGHPLLQGSGTVPFNFYFLTWNSRQQENRFIHLEVKKKHAQANPRSRLEKAEKAATATFGAGLPKGE